MKQHKPKVYKGITLDRDIAKAIGEIARKERRSFTKTAEILLEQALERQGAKPAARVE